MPSYLYRYSGDETPQANSAFVGALIGGDKVYLMPNEDADATLIGEWGNDGQLVSMDDFVYSELRPFGNDAGFATGHLGLIHYQGHAQRHMQDIPAVDTLPYYFSNLHPFVIHMERYKRTGEWTGWSWKATIEFSDPNREPTNRAIGIYPGGDWDAAGWNTGAFVWTEVDRDIDGNPVMKWQTECPAGRETSTKEPLYYALLHGSAHEGRMELPEGKDALEKLFWEHDQPVPVEGEWADSGQTVAGMAGTVTLIQDNSGFSAGSLVRIEGVEMEVTSLWTGTGIVLDPYRVSTVGAVVEIWQ